MRQSALQAGPSLMRGGSNLRWNKRPALMPDDLISFTNLSIQIPGLRFVPSVCFTHGTENFAPDSWFPFNLPVTTNIKNGSTSRFSHLFLLFAVPVNSIRTISLPHKPVQKPPLNHVPISATLRRMRGLSVCVHRASRARLTPKRTSMLSASSCLRISPTLL
jgi:hypothetical protein